MVNEKVKELMESYGFSFMDTGGGCTAFHRPGKYGNAYLLITKYGGVEVPTSKDDPVLVGCYSEDRPLTARKFDSLDEFLNVWEQNCEIEN